jgi:hypothetical protein
MPRHSDKKKAKEAIAKSIMKEVTGAGPGLKAARKHKKKGGGTFGAILAGAAKVAGELAPAIIPMLLSSNGHAGSLRVQQGAPQSGGVGIATGASIQPLTGLTGMSPIKTGDKITGVTVTGMEYVGSVPALNPATGNAWEEGDLCFELSLNPLSDDWSGTRIFTNAHLYERWRPKRMAVIYQPASATTVSGQFIGYIDPDPAEPLSAAGREAVQVASSHVGAEMNQPWQMGCASYCYDTRTQDFYLDVTSDDVRLISGGNYRLLAATDLGAAGINTYGDIFVAYEIDLKVPDKANSNALGGGCVVITASPEPLAAVPAATVSNTFFGNYQSPTDIEQYGSMASRAGFESFTTPIGVKYGPKLTPGSYMVYFRVKVASGGAITLSSTGSAPGSLARLYMWATEEGTISDNGNSVTAGWKNITMFGPPSTPMIDNVNSATGGATGAPADAFTGVLWINVHKECHLTPVWTGGITPTTLVSGDGCVLSFSKIDSSWDVLWDPMSRVKLDVREQSKREKALEARIVALERMLAPSLGSHGAGHAYTVTLGGDNLLPMTEVHPCSQCGGIPDGEFSKRGATTFCEGH